jgi:thioredoxin reductase
MPNHSAMSMMPVFPKTGEHERTSRPGVFAIGNASNPIAHLAHAAAAGEDS